MHQAILTVGVSGSGKTSWAKQFVADNSDWVIVCRDDIRAMQGFPPLGNKEQENIVTKIQRGLVEAAFLDGFNVIIADTNLNKQIRNNMVRYLHKHQADVDFQVFNTPIETCIEWDSKRPAPVGEDIIRLQYQKFRGIVMSDLEPQPAEKFDPIEFDWTKEDDVFVFDIDGTLAEHVARSPYEYDKVATDAVIESVAAVATILGAHGRFKIIFVSGRPDSCRDDTEAWLKENLNRAEVELYMRKAGDDRADWIIKSEIYDREILPHYNVVMAFDDRDQVVRHMRARGVTVAQVANGRF